VAPRGVCTADARGVEEPQMRFDHFEFDPETDRLGEGPLSEVYRATDTRLGRTVALKILRAHAEIDPAADTRFQREAQHASNLTHPNIATIYEYGEAANTAFIAMEYLEGQTLDRILKDRTPGIEECLRIAVKVCSALAQVHRAGLIHRDLKPGNIMVLHDGDVKLLDFGIARASNESSITQHGTLVGTVLYMSPEQVRGDEMDSRSDIFSLGAVLYHMSTGRLPFPGKSFPEVCMGILDGRFEPPSALRPGLPDRFEQLIQRCLAPDPADRYQAADAVLIELEQLGKGVRRDAAKPVRLEGRLRIPPIHCPGDATGECRDMAGSLRLDLAAELARVRGLEVQTPESSARPGRDECDYLLSCQLTRSRPKARLDLVLEPHPDGGDRRLFDKVEKEDEDEWALQDDLVRAAARLVRRRLEELGRSAPAAVIPHQRERAVALARRAHDVLGRGTSKHLMSAMSLLRSALEADPTCALAHAGLAEALVRKHLIWEGDETFIHEAREMAEKALKFDPDCAEAHTSLGLAYQVSGFLTDAAREYRNAIRHDQDEWLAHRLLGEVLAREGNLKSAASMLLRAINLNRNHIPAYDLRYSVLQRLDRDRYEEALDVADEGISAARRHLEEVPDDQQARLHLAILLARLASRDEARRHVERAIEMSPKDGYVALRAACAYAVIGDTEAALEQLRRARDRGYHIQPDLRDNPDLDSVRELDAFDELVG
jgi:Tfp pilus assembly protein PilF/predicted Ser/Thr protein kinase